MTLASLRLFALSIALTEELYCCEIPHTVSPDLTVTIVDADAYADPAKKRPIAAAEVAKIIDNTFFKITHSYICVLFLEFLSTSSINNT